MDSFEVSPNRYLVTAVKATLSATAAYHVEAVSCGAEDVEFNLPLRSINMVTVHTVHGRIRGDGYQDED